MLVAPHSQEPKAMGWSLQRPHNYAQHPNQASGRLEGELEDSRLLCADRLQKNRMDR